MGEGGVGVGIKDYKMIGGGRDTERIIRIIKEGEGGRMRKTVGLIFYLICCDLCCSWLGEPPRRHIRGRTVY